jgi:hypothetical protein
MTNENKPTIELGKKYQTREGREVRIYAVDTYGYYPIHGVIDFYDGHWILARWTENGKNLSLSPENDLIEIKPKRKIEFWIVIEKYNCQTHFTSESAARNYSNDPLAILHFTREY